MKNFRFNFCSVFFLMVLFTLCGSCFSDNGENTVEKKPRTEKTITSLKYENEPNKLHLVIVSTSPLDLAPDQEKLKKFNSERKESDLRLNKVFLSGREQPIIGIRTFNSLSDAEQYKLTIIERGLFTAEKVMPISGDNYRRLRAKKDLPEYWNFYQHISGDRKK